LGQSILIETRSFAESIKLTRQIDALCFPPEMWLGNDEVNLLVESEAESTIICLNGVQIGQGITLSERFVADHLEDGDPAFVASERGVYSYSEAIIPEYQNQGYGVLLLQEISIRMRQRGFSSISAHVRTRFGWHAKRRSVLRPFEQRMLHDFWENPAEKVEFQRSVL
jgi:GNAT superfamily N-acetyltransferase